MQRINPFLFQYVHDFVGFPSFELNALYCRVTPRDRRKNQLPSFCSGVTESSTTTFNLTAPPACVRILGLVGIPWNPHGIQGDSTTVAAKVSITWKIPKQSSGDFMLLSEKKDLGWGWMTFLPEKLRNARMGDCWNRDANALMMSEKQRRSQI